MTADRLAAVGESCDHRRDQGPGLIRLPDQPVTGRAAVADQTGKPGAARRAQRLGWRRCCRFGSRGGGEGWGGGA